MRVTLVLACWLPQFAISYVVVLVQSSFSARIPTKPRKGVRSVTSEALRRASPTPDAVKLPCEPRLPSLRTTAEAFPNRATGATGAKMAPPPSGAARVGEVRVVVARPGAPGVSLGTLSGRENRSYKEWCNLGVVKHFEQSLHGRSMLEP